MARIRTVKPSFFTSLTVSELTPEQRLTFIGLWTHVDDEGRCVDDARLVKAVVWPLDDLTADDVEEHLDAIARRGLIHRYKVGGRGYLHVTGWLEHQRINRPSESGLPPPPAETSLNGHGGLTEDSPGERKGKEGKGTERKGTTTAPSASRTPPDGNRRGTRLKPDWTPQREDELQQRATDVGIDLRDELAKFRDYWQAKTGAGATKRDWQATWRNWIRTAIERTPKSRTVDRESQSRAESDRARQMLKDATARQP